MKHSFLYIILILFQIGVCQKASAQKNPQNLITGDFYDISIVEFTQAVEKQTDYFFYFDVAQFDSLHITIQANQEPLESLLRKIFTNTEYYFSIDPQRHVFLTRKVTIQTSLVPNPEDTAKKGRFVNNIIIAGEGDDPDNKAQAATLENKVYRIGDGKTNSGQSNALISGYVRDSKTSEPIIGASIYIDKPRIGVSSDQYGYYTISLPKGHYTLNIQSIGMKDTRRKVMLLGDGKLNIDLQSQVMMLKNVIVSAQKLNNVKGLQMGVQKLDIKTIKQVPVVFGEADLIRVLLTLPGVQSVGEASTGLNVRGGSADQNLIL